jgi:hypothetical protein
MSSNQGMPPRWLSLAIIVFWLAVTGYLFWRDLLPQLLPGQPPCYAIELVEEARTERPYVTWFVEKDGDLVAHARTRVEHRRRDVFELVCQIKPAARDKTSRSAAIQSGNIVGNCLPSILSARVVAWLAVALPPGRVPPFSANGFLVNNLDSTYRVDADGNLLGLSIRVNGKPDIQNPVARFLLRFLKTPQDLQLSIDGEVVAGQMTPRLQGEILDSSFASKKVKLDLPTVSVPSGGGVLLPLHPVNRLRGLSLGQTWTMHVLDPLGDSLSAFGPLGSDDRILRARVRPREELFTKGRYTDLPCLVIDYDGDDMKPSTWVARESGLVMCQEATLDKIHWAMYRE